LFGAIGLARAQAIARNEHILLLPRGAGGTDWTQGWTVFADRDGDGVPGAGDDILSVHEALPAGVTAAFAFTSPAAPYYIAYNGAGRSCGWNGAASAAKLTTATSRIRYDTASITATIRNQRTAGVRTRARLTGRPWHAAPPPIQTGAAS